MQNKMNSTEWQDKAISYTKYLEIIEFRAANPNPEDDHDAYYRLNWQRTKRIGKTYRPSDKFLKALQSITDLTWMIITEPWCGDSAQNLPYLAVMADTSDKINLKIVIRDENPQIMDGYLTNGSRSIPKLVVFNASGQEIFQWGPRPEPAVALFSGEKTAGTPKEIIIEKLHKWYAVDRGKTLETEILEQLMLSGYS